MSTIEALRSVRGLFAKCPSCREKFSLRDANLFDASQPLPKIASEYLQAQRIAIAREIQAIRQERAELKRRSSTSAETSGVGRIVEMLSPSLLGFPLCTSDCRTLLQPIDYVGFKGISITGEVEALVFIEVKSGCNSLTPQQRQIKRVIEQGRVQFVAADHRLVGSQEA
jgi:predicted Holliday junction resolvase-like endonuclease